MPQVELFHSACLRAINPTQSRFCKAWKTSKSEIFSVRDRSEEYVRVNRYLLPRHLPSGENDLTMQTISSYVNVSNNSANLYIDLLQPKLFINII
ncbi:hypothetical protein NQ315_013679 [Exocentrus adspersus]|uniref:Uncharacterized protein n=1 Tax=Exocentrus adspersus TaxID=1586481 RepID=A0AAV8W4G4_9CUCU|nr:hypothetical protein NQ315_013679 [Exocentrus adspersus]